MARKSANADGVRVVKAVYVREPYDGGSKYRFIRQAVNKVEYEWGDGSRTTGWEICPGNRFRSLGQETSALSGDQGEVYDGVEIYDTFPARIARTDKFNR